MLSPGRPKGTYKELTQEASDKIIEGFQKTLVLRRAALYAHETPHHVKTWLEMGEDDANNLRNTKYAQLFFDVGSVISNKASKYINDLESCPRNWQSLSWIMECCLHQDYGPKSQEIQELIQYVEQIKNKLEGEGGDGKTQNESEKEITEQ